jgi:hypothetical protein
MMQEPVKITRANAETCEAALKSLRDHLEVLAQKTKTYPVECVFGEYRFVFTSRADITRLIDVLSAQLAAFRQAA